MLLKIISITLFVAVCFDAVSGQVESSGVKSQGTVETTFHYIRTDREFLLFVWKHAKHVVPIVVVNEHHENVNGDVNQIKQYFIDRVPDVIILYLGNAQCLCAEKYFKTQLENAVTFVMVNNHLHDLRVSNSNANDLNYMLATAISVPSSVHHYYTVTTDMVRLINEYKPDLGQEMGTEYQEMKALADREQRNRMDMTHGLTCEEKVLWPELASYNGEFSVPQPSKKFHKDKSTANQ